MKKSILALAVASAASLGSVAQADNTTLYGSVRMQYNYNNAEVATLNGNTSINGAVSTFKRGVSEIGNAGSRFGIKGSDDLGNGLSAFYKYENRIEEEGGLKTNKLYVGLEGSFGSFSLGKQDIPHDWIGGYSDPFNKLAPDATVEDITVNPNLYSDQTGALISDKVFNGSMQVKNAPKAKYGQVALTSSSNSLVYVSPDMSGFQVGAAIIADGHKKPADVKNANNERHIDRYNIAAQYKANGIHAALSYQGADGDFKKENIIGVGLGYGTEQFEVGLRYEHANINYKTKRTDGYGLGGYRLADGKTKTDWFRIAGKYNISESDSIYAGYSKGFGKTTVHTSYHNGATGAMLSSASGTSKQYRPSAASLGYQHNFSKRTRVWAEYGYKDSDTGSNSGKVSTVSLGLRTDF